ncbi:hypothetical protein J3R83DRAFT_10146 [Lanmaoa asiatica]|nr:hypothetical protein J3R83DRAFT_10146 [Lanmaoa asiatica]
MESSNNQLPVLVKDKTTYPIVLDKAFLDLLRTPVARGGIHGTAGNGIIVCSIDAVLALALRQGHLDHNWKQLMGSEEVWPKDSPIEYFACPHCQNSWI